MQQASHELDVQTRGAGLVEITSSVRDWVRQSRMKDGVLTLFIKHTSASLTVQENADPDVKTDLLAFFERIAPEGPYYIHDAEGPDDMPAHIKSALTQVSLSIPLVKGRLALGTWQGVYVFEHRRMPHVRKVTMHLIGE